MRYRLLLALALVAPAWAEDPPDPKARFREAWLLEVEGDDPKTASEAYLRVEDGFPDSLWLVQAARVRRAACLLRLGRGREARALAEKVEPLPEFAPTLQAVLAATASPPPELTEDGVRALAAKLGDPRLEVREGAQKDLTALGEKEAPLLRRIREDAKDAEIRERLSRILQEWEGREVWTGYYRQGGKEYPFLLVFKVEPDGSFSGEIREPCMDWGSGETMGSAVSGRRNADGTFLFVKQYENGGPRWVYEGKVRGDRVEGRYAETDGTEFVLRRERL